MALHSAAHQKRRRTRQRSVPSHNYNCVATTTSNTCCISTSNSSSSSSSNHTEAMLIMPCDTTNNYNHHRRSNFYQQQQHHWSLPPPSPSLSSSSPPSAACRVKHTVSNKIHQRVQVMLSKSRRTRNTNNTIRLIQPHDILSVDRVLGSGAFSQVSAVTVRGTNENHTPGGGVVYACKHLQRKLLEDDEAATATSEPFFTAAAAATSTTSNEFQLAAAELAYEAHLLSSFDHPHIIKIRGWTENG